jgi:hypothetical protein
MSESQLVPSEEPAGDLSAAPMESFPPVPETSAKPADLEPIPPPSPAAEPPPSPAIAPAPPPTKSQPEKETSKRRRRGSLFFPLLLIALGVVLLLNNLGIISGSYLENLINLWPVLFIVWGLDSIWRGEGLTGAIFLLGLGTVFLLGNLGYLRLNPWQVLLTILPALLVAIGIDILTSRHRRWWTTLLGLIVVAAIMVGALWLAGVNLQSGQAVIGEQVEYGLQGATRAEVTLAPAAGSLVLDRLTNSDALLAGTIPTSTETRKTTQEFSKIGDTAVLRLQTTGTQFYYPSNGQNQSVWDLGLTPTVPVKLVVSLGAGDAKLDLTGLQMAGLEYDMGAGAVTITLPETGKFTASVNGAVGSIVILVPPGMEVKLDSNTALAARSLPTGYTKDNGNSYLSPGFSTSQNQTTLDLSLAIGQVSIRAK